jgi:4-amino-4-deoxychorismate lyase
VSGTVLVNGIMQDVIPVQDRGLLYGDGLFETIAIARGVPLLWDLHMRRLCRSCARLGIAVPDVDLLRADLQRMTGGREREVGKIVVTRGVGARGYAPSVDAVPTRIVSVSEWRPRAGAGEGVAVRFCRTRLGRNPALAGLKHLNRLEQVLARAELSPELAEGLMLNDLDEVVEGTMTNVFAVSGGELITPDLAECGVAGVLREFILENSPIVVREAPLARATLPAADEIFLTNSIIGVWPVSKLAERSVPVGPVTRRIQELVRDSHAAV